MKPHMTCKKCNGKLDVVRMCRKVRLRCKRCLHEYQVHEIAEQLDSKTEAILGQYTSIIYD